MQFPWQLFQQPTQRPKPSTPYEVMVARLIEGVPPELAARAAGIEWDSVKEEPEVVRAVAEGEILLFERARDGGVTGTIRAAQRYETKSWTPKAELDLGKSVEDYLRE